MTRIVCCLAVLSLIIAGAGSARADEKTSFYVSLSPALTSPSAKLTSLDEIEIDASNLGDGISTGNEPKIKMKFGLGINGEVGYKWRTNIRTGLEVGYRTSDMDQVKSSTGTGLIDGQLETSTIFLNVAYDFDNSEGPAPYVFGGLGAAYHEVDIRSANGVDVGKVGDDLTFAFQVGFGMYKPINEFIDAGLGYRYVFSNDQRFGLLTTEYGIHQLELTLRLF
ncbi:MAG: porin family protein [Nitrospina sp.]|nr:porin family protein [Nitrospina sp.]